MSSYMVASTTIDRVVEGMHYACHYSNDKKLRDAVLRLDRTTLGGRLVALNARAMKHRYGKTIPRKEREYRYKDHPTTDGPQLVKSMLCFLYQCMEGNTPQSSLYRLVEQCMGIVAVNLVTSDQSFDELEWG